MIYLRRHLNYLVSVFTMSYSARAIYRLDFVFRIVRPIFEILITLTLLNAVFTQTSALGNWNQTEASLVAAIALMTISLVMLFFGNGIENLYRNISEGTLDSLLLQPMDAQWLVSTRVVYVTNVFRVIFSFILFLTILVRLGGVTNFSNLLLFFITFISGAVIYYCLMLSASIISFWSLSGEQFFIVNNITSISKYPIDIFGQILKAALTIFPVIFIATVPAQALLGQSNLLIYLSPFIALLAFYLTRRFWLKGLRAYDSVSS